MWISSRFRGGVRDTLVIGPCPLCMFLTWRNCSLSCVSWSQAAPIPYTCGHQWGTWGSSWDHLPLLPLSSHQHKLLHHWDSETLQPNSTDPPHSPHIAPGTHLVWWSATRCPPTLFLYVLTKHSAPFCHEPDCFSLCPIHHCHSHCASYCFQFTPLGPHFQYPPCLLKLLTPILPGIAYIQLFVLQ